MYRYDGLGSNRNIKRLVRVKVYLFIEQTYILCTTFNIIFISYLLFLAATLLKMTNAYQTNQKSVIELAAGQLNIIL